MSTSFYLMSPFHPRDEAGQYWDPSFREDAVLERHQALLCCIEGIRQLMKPEELGEVVREILLPPQEDVLGPLGVVLGDPGPWP